LRKFRITVNGQTYEVEVEEIKESEQQGAAPSVKPQETAVDLGTLPPAANGGKTIKAPMPGKIVALKVEAGDRVKAGDVVAVLEAMKMENELIAPIDGIVQEVKVKEGASVNLGDPIVLLG